MKKFLLALSLLVILPVVVIAGLNFMDESLDPRSATTGDPRAVTVPEAENGYYALLALGAADGADGRAYATAFVNESRAAAKENREERQPQQKRAKRPDLCDPVKTSCIDAVRNKAGEFNQLLEAYKEDLERYQALLASKKFEDVLDFTARYTTGLPPGAALSAAQRAHLTQAALDLEAGNTEAAANAIELNLNWYRVMLSGSITGLSRMLAVRGYNTTLAFAKDSLAQRSAALAAHLPKWQEAMKSVSSGTPGFDAVFDTEFGVIKSAIRDPAAVAAASGRQSWIVSVAVKVLYQPNATLNRARLSYDEMAAAAKLPAGEFKAAWEKITNPYGDLIFKDYFINPMGKILLNTAIPDMSGVITRQHEALANNAALLKEVDAAIATVSPLVAKKAGEEQYEKPADSGK